MDNNVGFKKLRQFAGESGEKADVAAYVQEKKVTMRSNPLFVDTARSQKKQESEQFTALREEMRKGGASKNFSLSCWDHYFNRR